MQSDKLLVLTVFLLAVAGITAYQLLGYDIPERRPLIPSNPREFLGISLQLHKGWENSPNEKYVKEIADSGADTVCIVVCAYQENATSVNISFEWANDKSEERLKELLRYSRQADARTNKRALKLVLMPIVLLEEPERGQWRGALAPSNWNTWWRNYTNLIVKCAEIGEETGAEVLIIGSELISTECQVQRWKRLIAKVRSVYKGRLCYSANWDHYRPITWWDQLDIIGMTAYHNLSRGKKPTLKLLKEAWQPLREKILKWRNEKYPNHPILFTEVGWPNQVTCAEYPWDYYRATNRPDPQTQADCFEAFFATWMDEPAVAGYLIWEWRNHPEQRTGPRDTSYVPCGKPAQTVIEKHFRSAAEKKLMSGSGERRARSRRAVE